MARALRSFFETKIACCALDSSTQCNHFIQRAYRMHSRGFAPERLTRSSLTSQIQEGEALTCQRRAQSTGSPRAFLALVCGATRRQSAGRKPSAAGQGEPADGRRAIRQVRAAPLLEQLQARMKKKPRFVSPKSETAEATIRYLSDGRIEIANSAAQLAQAADNTRGLLYCLNHPLRNALEGPLSDPGYIVLPSGPETQPTPLQRFSIAAHKHSASGTNKPYSQPANH
jgi:hypothetical protein